MRDPVRRARRLAWAALELEVTLYRPLGRWIARRPDVPFEQIAGFRSLDHDLPGLLPGGRAA